MENNNKNKNIVKLKKGKTLDLSLFAEGGKYGDKPKRPTKTNSVNKTKNNVQSQKRPVTTKKSNQSITKYSHTKRNTAIQKYNKDQNLKHVNASRKITNKQKNTTHTVKNADLLSLWNPKTKTSQSRSKKHAAPKQNKNKFKITWTKVIIFAIVAVIIALSIIIPIGVNSYQEQKAREAEEERQYQIQKAQEEEALRIKQAEEAKVRAEHTAMNLQSLNLPAKKLNVPVIYQHPELPAGCEALALTNMINYYGYNLTKFDIIKKYLSYSNDDFVNYYIGSPYKEFNGGAAMCPAIQNAADSFISANNAPLKSYDLTGKEFEDLFAYIERGNPVQIWTSVYMNALTHSYSQSGKYKLYDWTHSVVLSGFDRAQGIVYIADSIVGNVSYSIDRVKEIYKKNTSQALVLISDKELELWGQGIDASYDNTIPQKSEEEETEEEQDSTDSGENSDE